MINLKGVFITVTLVILSFSIGFFSNEFIRPRKMKGNSSPTVLQNEKRQSGFKFINPILDCYSIVNIEPPSVIKLKGDIESYINDAKKLGKAEHISVYFRDLNNGPIIGIDPEETYAPASLLKVPILIAVFKEEEKNPGFLSKRVRYTQLVDPNYSQNIVDSVTLKIGNSYSILDLTERMIIHSDNESKGLIMSFLSESNLVSVFQELGIIVPGIRTSDDFMSIRDYASFFRILYNGTYLSHANSEKALEILTKTSFSRGIKAGVSDPYAIIAHKFGERVSINSKLMQLHDCGIVYSNGKTYLLCVMTKGDNFDILAKNIEEISRLIFNRVVVNK